METATLGRGLAAAALLLAGAAARAAQIEFLEARPLAEVVQTAAKPVAASGRLMVPVITWGGDVATVHARMSGLFKEQGLDVELFLENNFPKQVEAVLAGKTPYLRGTLGMINAAAETFQKQGIGLVVIHQLTWSNGGDMMVVRPGIKSPLDLKNRTLALQLYGPHMDYVANILRSAEVPLGTVRFRWLRELSLPQEDTGGLAIDPVTAFLNDPSIDAVMCISPDAMNLTSGGQTGTGAAGSVKGARILLSTKTASRVIADVYAVRSDYFGKNRAGVEKFVRALLRAQDQLADLLGRKEKPADFQKLLAQSAELLLGTAKATADVEGLLADCEFAGQAGNISFFTGQGTTRTLQTLTDEVQTAFLEMGLIKRRVALQPPGWDYASLGANRAGAAADRGARFDPKKVAARLEKEIAVEPTEWAEAGTLFQIETRRRLSPAKPLRRNDGGGNHLCANGSYLRCPRHRRPIARNS